jgi:hypothetical protein
MKKRVKILASAFLLLGFLSLSTETSRAAAKCWNIVDLEGRWTIWRCTPGPEGCVSVEAKDWQDDHYCSDITS